MPKRSEHPSATGKLGPRGERKGHGRIDFDRKYKDRPADRCPVSTCRAEMGPLDRACKSCGYRRCMASEARAVRHRDGTPRQDAHAEEPMPRCGASALRGYEVCDFHGAARKNRRHGLYSQAGPAPLWSERVQKLVGDPRTFDLRESAAQLYVAVQDAVAKIDAAQDGREDGETCTACGHTPAPEVPQEQIDTLLKLAKEHAAIAAKYHQLEIDKRYVDLVEASGLMERTLAEVFGLMDATQRERALAVLREHWGDDGTGLRRDDAASLH